MEKREGGVGGLLLKSGNGKEEGEMRESRGKRGGGEEMEGRRLPYQ